MLYHSPILDPLILYSEKEFQQPVLYTRNSSHTPREILNESKHLAIQLQKLGLQQDDVAIIAVPPGIEFIKIMYATVMLRLKAAIIDPEMGPDLYKAKLEQLKPRWAFVDTRLLFLQEHPIIRYIYFKLSDKPVYFPRYKGLRIIACGMELPLVQKYISVKKIIQSPIKPEPIEPCSDNFDYLITYTSGTLQEPKGVVHSFHSLAKSIHLLSQLVKSNNNDIMGVYLPHFALIGLTAQLPVYLYKPNISVEEKLNFFQKKRISILFGPPSDFLPWVQYCEKHGKKLPSALKHLILGSAPVHRSFLRRLYAVCSDTIRITITYGMTEHLLVSTVDGAEKLNYTGIGDLVGKPVEGVHVKLAEDGELLIKSEQLYSRYFHITDRDEYHATGDLAEIDANGNILLMGRKKEMIIRRNTNIYPALYEDTIKRIPGVEEAAMVGIYSVEKEDEEVFLAIESALPMKREDVFKKLSYGTYQIEKAALPDKIVFMKIPRKGRQNKIDRNQIVKLIKCEDSHHRS